MRRRVGSEVGKIGNCKGIGKLRPCRPMSVKSTGMSGHALTQSLSLSPTSIFQLFPHSFTIFLCWLSGRWTLSKVGRTEQRDHIMCVWKDRNLSLTSHRQLSTYSFEVYLVVLLSLLLLLFWVVVGCPSVGSFIHFCSSDPLVRLKDWMKRASLSSSLCQL